MNITYKWPVKKPNDIDSVTIETSGNIPRVGELVYLRIQKNKDSYIEHSGRVEDVINNIMREPCVTIFLSK